MARLRYNGLTTTLGAALTSTDTTITFAAALTHSGGTAVPTISGSDYIPLTILTSAGAVSEIVSLTAYTSGATTGTITRAQESTTAAAHAIGDAVVNAPTAADLVAAASGGGIIAYNSRNPASLVTYAVTGTTLADVDATNMAVTFTAPASGNVLVRLTACAARSATTGTGYWGLRSGTTQVGSLANVRGGVTGTFPSTAEFPITGLTPGGAYTYKWAAQVDNGTLSVYAGGPTGGIAGPAVMTVLALP